MANNILLDVVDLKKHFPITSGFFNKVVGQVKALKKWWGIGPFPAPSHKEGIAKMSWRTEEYNVAHGASMRLLLDYAHYGKAEGMWFVLPTGNSGHVLSPHHDDQAEMYLDGKYRNIHFSQEAIEEHQEVVTTFKPSS